MPRFDDHPLQELTVRGGKLIRREPAGYDSDYLVTSPIQITEKKGFFEGDSTDVLYRFDLNDRPDQTWIAIFNKCRGDLDVQIGGAELQLKCIPANLEGRYGRVKEAISETNRLFAEHKDGLINKVKDLDVQREQHEAARAARSATVTDQFKNLPL